MVSLPVVQKTTLCIKSCIMLIAGGIAVSGRTSCTIVCCPKGLLFSDGSKAVEYIVIDRARTGLYFLLPMREIQLVYQSLMKMR